MNALKCISFNFYNTESAKENIYVKIFAQKCKTKYKLILKARKAGRFWSKSCFRIDLQNRTKLRVWFVYGLLRLLESLIFKGFKIRFFFLTYSSNLNQVHCA